MIRRGGTIDNSQRWYEHSHDGAGELESDEGGLGGGFGGTGLKSILGRGEHWWDQVSTMYTSDVCQFRDI
jgi:hypothetical protein